MARGDATAVPARQVDGLDIMLNGRRGEGGDGGGLEGGVDVTLEGSTAADGGVRAGRYAPRLHLSCAALRSTLMKVDKTRA